jgi:hypothetical protein
MEGLYIVYWSRFVFSAHFFRKDGIDVYDHSPKLLIYAHIPYYLYNYLVDNVIASNNERIISCYHTRQCRLIPSQAQFLELSLYLKSQLMPLLKCGSLI